MPGNLFIVKVVDIFQKGYRSRRLDHLKSTQIKLEINLKEFIRDYCFSLFNSAVVVVDRSGIVWRRSQGSGGSRSVKVVPKRAPGRGPAA